MSKNAALRSVIYSALVVIPLAVSAAQTPPPAQAPAPAKAPPARTPPPMLAPVMPAARVVDLTTSEGAAVFGAQWKNKDVRIVEAPAWDKAGPAWKTSYVIEPRAGDASFDDASWPVIEPKSLLDRRGGGGIYMTWFRTNLTVPQKIGDFDTTGAIAVLTVTLDDYAEVWVNGQLPRTFGRTSPATIQGYNMPNRVVLTETVKPAEKFVIAILGINGPLSMAPPNPVFFREAKIEFFR